MKNEEIEELASHLVLTNERCSHCVLASDALKHMQVLQTFVADLARYHARPGSPEKTAEHYQIVHRAKALNAMI